MKPASPRQLEVLAYMRAYFAEHTMWPSMREIAVGLGIASTNAVNDLLLALERRGLVKHRPKVSRGWVVVQQQREAA